MVNDDDNEDNYYDEEEDDDDNDDDGEGGCLDANVICIITKVCLMVITMKMMRMVTTRGRRGGVANVI